MISNPDLLASAQQQWNSLIRIGEPPNFNWTHKIDIKYGSGSHRWLYNKEGYVTMLNKRLKPIFKVSNVKLLNEIFLG